jgi:hypothetical protein
MSLRLRLTLVTTGLVAAVAIVLLAVELNTLISVSLEHTEDRARLTAQFVKRYVMDRAQSRAVETARGGLDESIEAWRGAIAADTELPEFLAATLAQTRSIVEISVAGRGGRILASSNPARAGQAMASRLSMQRLLALGPLERFQAVLGGRIDYENRIELGVDDPAHTGRKEVVFTIQVLVSSVLLRDAILPEVRRTALASLPLLVLSILIAWLISQLATLPLAGISRTIDRIASGEEASAPEISSTRELAVVQEKLRMLGEQFRGAQVGATQLRGNVEHMLERLEETIFLFDASGRLMVCGEAVERLLKLTRAEVAGRRIDELFPISAPVGARLAEAITARRRLHEVRVGRLVLNLDFLPEGAMLLRLRDAEGRQMVESQLNLSTRLAAISRLTGRVAHEIKNPLNSIALRLELLKSRVLAEVPEAEGEISVIAQEITRLDRVVRTFLDFTRPIEIRAEELDIARMTRDLVDLLRPEADSQQVCVQTEGLDEPALLNGDADLLRQALLNVFRNALEAMPEGGRLGVRLERGLNEAALEVSDTGPGVPRDMRDKIFHLYYTTKKHGSGIGLAMTYRAIQLHNGAIEVDGDEGQGAIFRLRLPLEQEAGS